MRGSGIGRLLTRFVVGLTMIHVAGLHWVLLQMLAWSGMLVIYLPESGFREGLVETFSGQRPCTLCSSIEEGREQEEKETPAPTREAKREVLPPGRIARSVLGDFPDGFLLPFAAGGETRAVSWSTTPEPPPPRAVVMRSV